jgi:hypothetical protein
MKRIFILLIALIFTFTALDTSAQTKKKKKYRGLATNIAIIGGGTGVGALIGGKKGAVIGAGGGTLYASSRKGTKRRYANSKTRRWAKIAGGTALGTGIGMYGGKRTTAIGALAGAGATYLYTRNGRRYYTARNGRTFYVRNGRRYYVS